MFQSLDVGIRKSPSPDSLYAGGFSYNGWPFIVRLHWAHTVKVSPFTQMIRRFIICYIFQKAVVDVLSTHQKGKVLSVAFPYETKTHGIIKHVRSSHHWVTAFGSFCHQVAIEVTVADLWTMRPSVAITTATGAVQLWKSEVLQWTREESLATISVAELVELPEKKVISSHVGEGQETVLNRLIRQLSDARVWLHCYS
jgi:hypothetical protein